MKFLLHQSQASFVNGRIDNKILENLCSTVDDIFAGHQ